MTLTRRLAVLAAGALSTVAVGATATPAQAATAPPPAPAPAAPATPCAPTARACVDLSAHRAWLTDGAGHVTHGPVAARGGSRSAPTPVGTFAVLWKDRDHVSRQFANAPMPNSVFFAPGIAFHGGDPSDDSNGCIHLGQKSSAAFFAALREGDRVQVVP
jgi:lipoprotein-anchoring transpeptidase ErfK/SrfK